MTSALVCKDFVGLGLVSGEGKGREGRKGGFITVTEPNPLTTGTMCSNRSHGRC